MAHNAHMFGIDVGTYIGSMPGKVMQNMKKAGTNNPLFLLDEIDKMGQDFRGDRKTSLAVHLCWHLDVSRAWRNWKRRLSFWRINRTNTQMYPMPPVEPESTSARWCWPEMRSCISNSDLSGFSVHDTRPTLRD